MSILDSDSDSDLDDLLYVTTIFIHLVISKSKVVVDEPQKDDGIDLSLLLEPKEEPKYDISDLSTFLDLNEDSPKRVNSTEEVVKDEDYSGLLLDGQFTLTEWRSEEDYSLSFEIDIHSKIENGVLGSLLTLLEQSRNDSKLFKEIINKQVLLIASKKICLPNEILRFVFQTCYSTKHIEYSLHLYKLLISIHPILYISPLYITSYSPSENDINQAFHYFGFPKDDKIKHYSLLENINTLIQSETSVEFTTSIEKRYTIQPEAIKSFPYTQFGFFCKYIAHVFQFYNQSWLSSNIYTSSSSFQSIYEDKSLYTQSSSPPHNTSSNLPYSQDYCLLLARRFLLCSLDPRLYISQIDCILCYKTILKSLFEAHIPFYSLPEAIICFDSIPDFNTLSTLLNIHPVETEYELNLRTDLAIEITKRIRKEGSIFV
ncbi:hypothetical protein WA158_001482 [Blastocystis sp. Blastoise]